MRLGTVVALLGVLAACETMPGSTPAGDIEGWSYFEHPCVGNRTDALLVEDADTLWVGCGSTTSGYGLYGSTDGGETWSAPETDPPEALDRYRVSSIQRASDGLLYLGGIDTTSSKRVVALDDSRSPARVIDVYEAGSQVWSSFHVGTFRVRPDGLAVAESLTGAGLVVRQDEGAPWEDGTGWWTSGSSVQLLDLVLDGGDLYGCGSTISEPPQVFLPAGGSGFALDPVVLGDGRAGELWGLDVHAGAVVAAGVDQDEDVGLVFVADADPRNADDFSMLDVSEVVGGSPTWMRGACRHDDLVVAVGEYSQLGDGIVLRSVDGGDSWEDVTPTEVAVPSVHRCEVRRDGTTFIAGADGWLGVAR